MGLIKSKDKEAMKQYMQHYINTMSEVVQCAICQFTIEEHPKLIFANDQSFDIIGYTREEFEEIFDNELLSIVHEYDYDRVVQFIFDIMLFDTRKEFDVRINRKDGQVRWVSCSVKRTVNADAVPVSLVSIEDITEKINYRKRIDELSENVMCGLARICLSEDDVEVEFANSIFYNMFSSDEKLRDKLFANAAFKNKIYNPIFRDGLPFPLKESFEFYHHFGKNEICCIKFTINYVGVDFEKPVYLCTFEDITDEKRAKSGRNELLSKLSGGIISVIFDETASCETVSASFRKLFDVSDYRLSGGFYSLFLEEERKKIKEDLYYITMNRDSFEFTGHIEAADKGPQKVKVCGFFHGERWGYPYYECYVFKCDGNGFFENDNADENIKDSFKLDELTGFYSRQYIGEIIDTKLSKSFSAQDGLFCVVILQNFAEINERYGYLFGDNLLVDIARLIRSIFGNKAIIGRTGGVEFSLFLKYETKESFSEMCDRLCKNITNVFIGEDDDILIKCKIGITFIEEEDFYQNMYNRSHIVLHRLLHDKKNKYASDFLFEEDAEIDIEKITDSEKYLIVEENAELANRSKKTDEAERYINEFMSRMSHEIRTPMNAISGMADMLLASGLSGMNLEYVNMIKSASNNLISIVDDILDISKIETGQIEIIAENYEIRTMIEDMSALINGKLDRENISFVVYVNPNLPKVLYGDEKHIKQIMMNILSNAVKFTRKGFIRLSVDFKPCGNDEIELCMSVKDSGIGIDKKDQNKLFTIFSQVDSRKNRKADGVGLGLAIAKQVAEHMGGSILVESEVGIGSKFSFVIRQHVIDSGKIVDISGKDKYSFLLYERDKYYREELSELFKELNIKYQFVLNRKDFVKAAKDKQYSHVFFDYGRVFYDLKFTIEKNPSIVYTAMIGRDTLHPQILDCENYKFVYKPFNIYDLENILSNIERKEVENLQKFICSGLKILIVDDNPVNLKVAQGLISSYKCKIETALSGNEALELLEENGDYDLLFIDHMMPYMDGVETLKNIRANLGTYGKNVPAVALTANVLPEARELFSDSGFQGFLAKPIVSKHLHELMDQLVPDDKKQMLETLENRELVKNISEEDLARVAMKGVDVESGLRCCGNNIADYLNILGVVLASGKIKVKELKRYAEEKNYEMYGIESHAFKSVAASIGAIKQSELAREHEFAVKEKQYNVIDKEYQKLINGYQRLLTQIQGVLDKEKNINKSVQEKKEVDTFLWKRKIKETVQAISNFEQRRAKDLLNELLGFKLPEQISSAVEQANEKMKIYQDEDAQKILEDIMDK